MEILLPAMVESCNGTIAEVGAKLTRFWNDDMETTVMYTPVQTGMDLSRPPRVGRASDEDEGDDNE